MRISGWSSVVGFSEWDWWLHVIFVILLLAGVFYSLPRWNGWPFSPRLRVWLDNIPPWSIYRYLNGTVFVMAMASLTAADSPEHGLYEMKQNATGRWLRSRIDRIHKYLSGGDRKGVVSGKVVSEGVDPG